MPSTPLRKYMMDQTKIYVQIQLPSCFFVTTSYTPASMTSAAAAPAQPAGPMDDTQLEELMVQSFIKIMMETEKSAEGKAELVGHARTHTHTHTHTHSLTYAQYIPGTYLIVFDV